jgi:hypothetical protein
MEEIADFFSNDPYQKNNLAHYQFIEFNPVKHQKEITEWIGN